MSDASQKDPSPADLEANSLPAFIRRAPRFARMVGTGGLAGFALGALLGLGLPGHGADYRATVALLVGIGLGIIGALTAAAIATRIDLQSRAAWRHPAGPEPTRERPASRREREN